MKNTLLKYLNKTAPVILWAGLSVLSASPGLFAAQPEPLVAIVGLPDPSPRQLVLNGLFSARLYSVLSSTGIFSIVDPAQLQRELTGAGCIEEPCLLRFAEAASIDMLIRVSVEERPGYSSVELLCYGMKFPHNGRIIRRHRVLIPEGEGEGSLQDKAFQIEEESGLFLAETLRRYRHPLVVKRDGDGMVSTAKGANMNGEFEVWRRVPPGDGKGAEVFYRIGSVRFVDGAADVEGSRNIRSGDVVLYRFDEKARFLDDFYYGRKKEMVFATPSAQDTLFMVLFTVPASAVMPLMAPLGYYGYGDYGGLLLWAANSAPYLYLEADGLLNRPAALRENNENISRSASARYYFGLYMLAAGGIPLFVDAFSHEYLSRASRYQGAQPLMGNTATAAYLSMVSGGAGHFYRGSRFWGYLYFHLNNIMVYYTIKEFCPSRRYDEAAGRYVQGAIDRQRAYAMLGVLGALKIVELTHVILSRDAVRAGSFNSEGSSLEPVFYGDEGSGLVAGLAGVYRW